MLIWVSLIALYLAYMCKAFIYISVPEVFVYLFVICILVLLFHGAKKEFNKTINIISKNEGIINLRYYYDPCDNFFNNFCYLYHVYYLRLSIFSQQNNHCYFFPPNGGFNCYQLPSYMHVFFYHINQIFLF